MNIIEKILPYLKGPESEAALIYNAGKNTLFDPVLKRDYVINRDIPVLLPEKEKYDLRKSPLHKEYNTTFFYLEHYKKDAEIFNYGDTGLNKSNKIENKLLHKTILKQIPLNAEKILDAGCGGGWLASKLKSTDKLLVSMDVSPTNPTNALENFPFDKHYAIVADVYNLPFKPDTFDCIVASEIMEHTVDPARFVEELVKIIKPGGKLIITTPYNEKSPLTLCVHCNKPTPFNAHLHQVNEKFVDIILKPCENISFSTRKFNNKFLVKFRILILLNLLGYTTWKLADRLFNFLFSNPTRFMIVIRKK